MAGRVVSVNTVTGPRTGVNHNPLQQAWIEFLGRERWDLFCTWTFKGERHVPWECIVRRIRRWLYSCLLDEAVRHDLAEPPVEGELRRRGQWPRAYRSGRAWALPKLVIGIEQSRQSADHAHGMIALPEFARGIRRTAMWAKWFYGKEQSSKGGEFGWGFAKIEPPRVAGDCFGYVVKASGYVAKGGEIYLSDSLRLPTLPVGTASGVNGVGEFVRG